MPGEFYADKYGNPLSVMGQRLEDSAMSDKMREALKTIAKFAAIVDCEPNDRLSGEEVMYVEGVNVGLRQAGAIAVAALPTADDVKGILGPAMTTPRDDKLREALEAARDHIKLNHKATAWHNDPLAWCIITKVIEPALKAALSQPPAPGGREEIAEQNRHDAEEFCKGAFGPFVVNVSQYAEIVTKLLQRASDRGAALSPQGDKTGASVLGLSTQLDAMCRIADRLAEIASIDAPPILLSNEIDLLNKRIANVRAMASAAPPAPGADRAAEKALRDELMLLRMIVTDVRIMDNAGHFKEYDGEPWLKRVRNIDLHHDPVATAYTVSRAERSGGAE